MSKKYIEITRKILEREGKINELEKEINELMDELYETNINEETEEPEDKNNDGDIIVY